MENLSLQNLGLAGLTYVAIALFVVYSLGYGVYNAYLHPLAKFPGPFLARSSLLWRMLNSMNGYFHISIEKQHQKYGPVFRVSPNELSFASVASWKDIYGQIPGRPILIKSDFYEIYGAGFDSGCIGSERNVQKHNRMKRSLANAFSSKALLEQEEIVQQCIDGFIKRLARDGNTPKGLNMTDWYEMIAFDILGEMAFGETFHCVEQGEPHFWQQMLAKHLFAITLVDNLRRYPLVKWLGQKFLSRATTEVRDKHTGFSRAKVASRLASKSGRKDFFTNIVEKVEAGEVSQEELTAHASTLIIAGGETVATFLTATTYFLCKSPSSASKLKSEIRSRFARYEDIESTSALQLPYLQAVINEGLRLFPPGSQGFPRTSPGATIDGYWVPAGTETYTSAWTVVHDPAYFSQPYEFIPERWLDPNSRDVKEASQPFSLGPRGCLGRNFAFMEMCTIMAKLHWSFETEMVDPGLDWVGKSKMHVQWDKPHLDIRFLPRKG